MLAGVPTSNAQLDVPKSTYWSGSFLKGLLLASIPLALYEHFNDVSSFLNKLKFGFGMRTGTGNVRSRYVPTDGVLTLLSTCP